MGVSGSGGAGWVSPGLLRQEPCCGKRESQAQTGKPDIFCLANRQSCSLNAKASAPGCYKSHAENIIKKQNMKWLCSRHGRERAGLGNVSIAQPLERLAVEGTKAAPPAPCFGSQPLVLLLWQLSPCPLALAADPSSPCFGSWPLIPARREGSAAGASSWWHGSASSLPPCWCTRFKQALSPLQVAGRAGFYFRSLIQPRFGLMMAYPFNHRSTCSGQTLIWILLTEKPDLSTHIWCA